MAYIDYYKILGIDKNASQDDVKKAYKKLARKFHPDLNPNNPEAHTRFQEINEANEVLSDPEKRKKYDQYGEHWKHADEFEAQGGGRQGGGFGGFSGGGFGGGGFGGGGFGEGGEFSDFFEQMFGGRGGARGGGRSRSRGYRGQDYESEMEISFKDAFETHKRVINVDGKSLRITIPAGIADGQTIKLSGQGQPGANGGPNGDLLITIRVGEDSRFKRVGDDLYATEPLDLFTAILGGEQVIETVTGKVKMKVAPGTQNNTKVRLKGKGFPVYKKEGQFGDLIVTYSINIPTNLTDKQRELFKEIQNLNA